MVQDRPKDSRIGTSSEWCGRIGDTPALVEKRSWTRSRSLKVKMTTLSGTFVKDVFFLRIIKRSFFIDCSWKNITKYYRDSHKTPYDFNLYLWPFPITVSPLVTVPALVVSSDPAPCTSINLPPPPPYPLVPTLSPPGKQKWHPFYAFNVTFSIMRGPHWLVCFLVNDQRDWLPRYLREPQNPSSWSCRTVSTSLHHRHLRNHHHHHVSAAVNVNPPDRIHKHVNDSVCKLCLNRRNESTVY